jgi:hypothetical protein
LSYLPIAHERVLALDAVARRRLQCGRMNGKQSYSNASRGRRKSHLSRRLAPLDADLHRELGSGEKKDRVRRMKTGYHNRAGGAKFSTFPRSLSDDGIDEGHFSEFC